MAVRIPNLVKKVFDQPQFSVSCPSWWDSNEQQIPLSLSKNICFKVESPPKVYHEAKHLGFQLLEHESSSSQSIGHSHSDVSASGGTSSRDQCISTESGQDEMNGAGGKLKSLFVLTTPDIAVNPSQTDSHLMVDPPYAYADPYVGGFFTTYGPHTIIQPQLGSQIVGTTALRVPLELADDGPIYVNAKQYHGILRRRQSRAKLEAQNKLVRSRKPYLHESRHLHALKRVRGTGGRFLSSKELQQPGTTSNHCKYSVMNTIQSHQEDSASVGTCHPRSVQSGSSNTSCSDINNISRSDVFYRQSNPQFSGMVTHIGRSMQSGGGVMCNGTNHSAPVVRLETGNRDRVDGRATHPWL